MKSFGICTSRKNIDRLNFEKRSLYEAAKTIFDRVLLIDSRNITYQLRKGEQKPKILLGNDYELSDLSVLHVRSTKNRETSTAVLVRALELCGCRISDPVERFSVGYASKILTTISRFANQVGTSSFIGFSLENTLKMVEEIEACGEFPLVAKPIEGKKGKGIKLLSNLNEAVDYISHFFISRNHPDHPILLQTYIRFESEYRLLVVDGKVLGTVKKHKAPGKLQANAAQGANFTQVFDDSIASFVLDNVSNEGILGVDVAIDSAGIPHILEANRAPQWQEFQKTTGINVAKEIVIRSLNYLENY